MSITLYHCQSARSLRALWALEELQLDYELKMLPFPPRVLAKEYKQENPLGTVPLFVEGELRMTESAAICQYLADRHGAGTLGVKVDEPEYGVYLNYVAFGEATLTFPQTLLLRYGALEPEERRQPQVALDYAAWFLARLRGLEARLDGREYVCERFTAADISIGYALLLATNLGLAPNFAPQTADYWLRLQQRAGYRRAMAAEDGPAEGYAERLTQITSQLQR